MELSLVLQAFFVFQMCFQVLLVSCSHTITMKGELGTSPFPRNFLFGTASSSYQFEGAFLTDGKGLNNWDNFTHTPGNIIDGSTGDVAVDHYHRYLEDLELMEDIGVNSYRFSISWARILPKGRFGAVNRAGVDHYNKFINAFLHRGIIPFVTLTHYDIPQELEDRYGGWLSPQVQKDFAYYADICFKYFGDRVKFWVTFNEPNIAVILGYRSGACPPAHCSGLFGNCKEGDSEREPFIAAHNIILSHSAAVGIYRTKYQVYLSKLLQILAPTLFKHENSSVLNYNVQKEQEGSIGIVMHTVWYEPISNSSEDKRAAERAQAFFMNWFLDPIIFGKYPSEMHEILGSSLPEFSKYDQEKLKNGLDFIGINQYTSFYVKDCIFSTCEPGTGYSKTEGFALQTAQNKGVFVGEPTDLNWLYVVPQGMYKMVTYIKERYNNLTMYITENGFGEKEKPTEILLNDVRRVNYMSGYLEALATAVRKGADVRGYFAWSLLDNFEWKDGYTVRFGLYHVDYTTLKRTRKTSATWYKQYIANHTTCETCEV